MRVLFVYPNVARIRYPQLGICSVAAVARDLGHECDLYDLTIGTKGEEFSAFASKLASFDPDLVAVSCRSSEWLFVKRLFESVDVGNRLKVFGGPHVTIATKEVMEIADVAVIGEGEETFSELLRAIDSGGNIANVAGCWVRQGDKIIKNEMRELISNLDELPIPQWELFDDVHYYNCSVRHLFKGAKVTGSFESSRGCPYSCAYCTNDYLRKLYSGKGDWRREKSPERIINEIQLFRNKYGLDGVSWVDEVILTNIGRLERFRDLYASEIGVPFLFMERPENMTSEKVRIIKQAGAAMVSIGIESGDETLRRDVLNRRHSQQTIVSAFRVAKEYGLTTHAFTMVGLPGENRKSIKETFKLLKEAKPNTVQSSTFYPLVGTKLRELVITQGLFDPDKSLSTIYYGESPLNFSKNRQKELFRSQYLLVNFNSVGFGLFNLAQRSELAFLLLRIYRFPQETFPRIYRILRGKGLKGMLEAAYRQLHEEGFIGLLRAIYQTLRA